VVFWKGTTCGFLLTFLRNPSFSLPSPGNPFSCQQEPEECAVCLPSHSFILLTFPPPAVILTGSAQPCILLTAHCSVEYFQIKRIAARSCSVQGLFSRGEAMAFCRAGAVLLPVIPCPGWQLLCSASLHVIVMGYRRAGKSTFPKHFPFPALPCMVLPFGAIS